MRNVAEHGEHVIVDHRGYPLLSETEKRAAMLDLEIAGLRRIQHEETRACLERLGYDVSRFTPPPMPKPWERPIMATRSTPLAESSTWPVGEVIMHREKRVVRRYFETPITVR